jgi:hypothetical protein
MKNESALCAKWVRSDVDAGDAASGQVLATVEDESKRLLSLKAMITPDLKK